MVIGRLQPHTKRLKRLIKDFGEEWEVLHIGPMPCFNGEAGVQVRALRDKTKISNIELEYVLIPTIA